uniref:DMT904 n=1 Tax=Arundo donax TaxID=35708 RepID=A0A0A8Y5Q2_ARUDO
MEPPPPDPVSPSSQPTAGAADASPGGGGDGDGAEGGEEGGFSAGLEPLWSLLFGDPELEPMWSPPRGFGVGAEFAAPEAEAEVEDAGGPWDGAPWRSTGVVVGEGAATTLALPTVAAGFPEFETAASDPSAAAEAVSPEAGLEVRPLESAAPDSSSPLSPCLPTPVDLEVRAPEPIAGSEAALSPVVASSGGNLEERMLECTLNSVPSPPPLPSPDDLDLEAEDAPKDWCSPEDIASGAMVVIGLDAKGHNKANADDHSMPNVVSGDGTSLRRSPRLVAIKAKANATLSERKADSSRASKNRLLDQGRGSISEGNKLPVSTSSFKGTDITLIKPFDSLNGVKRQGSQEFTALLSSYTNEREEGDVVVALPVVSKRSLKNKVVCSPRKTRSASKVLVNSDRASVVSPVMNCGPTAHKACSHIAPRKHNLPSEKCLLNFERVDGDIILRNSGLVSAKPQVGSEMPLELESTSSQPPMAKRVRISSEKCSSNLKRAGNNGSSICKLPMITMTLEPENKRKLILDRYSTDYDMVDSEEGSCFFVGEPVPDEEAMQRWPHRYGTYHHLYHHLLKKDKRSNTQTFSNAGATILDVKCHYLQASICGSTLCIGDCAFIKGPEGKPHYIGRLLEFF